MNVLLIFAGLLLTALVIEPLARRLRLPFSAALVAAGFAGSEALVAFGFDTGLRWYHFTDLISQLLLPILVFEAAFNLDTRDLLRNLVIIVWLAVPLLLVATFITAALVYWGIGHAGFSWGVALLTGVLLSATDPVEVSARCARLGVPARLPVILEGESLFNDATAIVLFTVLLGWAIMPGAASEPGVAALEFIRVFAGGLAAGIPLGLFGVLLMRAFNTEIPRALVTLGIAVSSAYLAELWQVSGVMAVLATGLLLGTANRRQRRDEFTATLWQMNAYVASALIFLLVGVTITVDMFAQQWLAMLIGIGAVLITRAIMVYALLRPVEWLPRVTPLSLAQRNVLYWGGLRGAATVALALSLPVELEAWWTVQSIAYGVVLFALFVQAPGLGLLLRRLPVPVATHAKASDFC